jgi:hypothetical protein
MLEKTEWVWKETAIPEALYETPQQLVQTLNDKATDVLGETQRNKIHFVYNVLLRKFTACVSQGYMVRFPKHLAIVLGLGDMETTLKHSKGVDVENRENGSRLVYDGDKIIPPLCMDLERGLHTFFVYCDLLEHQLVGDAHVPLLRSIAVSGKSGEVIAKSFDNIHYVGLSRSTFQDIHIHITDDTGVRVPFEQGRVIVKLHFRRK